MITWSPPFVVVVLGQLICLAIIVLAVVLTWSGRSKTPKKQPRSELQKSQLADNLEPRSRLQDW